MKYYLFIVLSFILSIHSMDHLSEQTIEDAFNSYCFSTIPWWHIFWCKNPWPDREYTQEEQTKIENFIKQSIPLVKSVVLESDTSGNADSVTRRNTYIIKLLDAFITDQITVCRNCFECNNIALPPHLDRSLQTIPYLHEISLESKNAIAHTLKHSLATIDDARSYCLLAIAQKKIKKE